MKAPAAEKLQGIGCLAIPNLGGRQERTEGGSAEQGETREGDKGSEKLKSKRLSFGNQGFLICGDVGEIANKDPIKGEVREKKREEGRKGRSLLQRKSGGEQVLVKQALPIRGRTRGKMVNQGSRGPPSGVTRVNKRPGMLYRR